MMLGDQQVREEWAKNQKEEGELYFMMIKQGNITLQDKTMHFQYNMIGPRPEKGYALIFGLHGGGGCPKEVNDQQYKNHLALYNSCLPPGVIWAALRSCQQAPDMWWKSYLPDFLSIIIKGFVLKEIVDPNRVYVTGYSAGGDGVYHLGPMLADWLAGAAMMAGHPNGVELYNVRNSAFSIQVGEKDEAYDRNNLAKKYIGTMQELSKKYGGFSTKYCHVFEDCCHWMNLKDAKIFSEFLSETRNTNPNFILFKQHPRYPRKNFYYLQVDPDRHKELMIVIKKGNEFHIQSEIMPVSIYVNRFTVDFGQEVKIFHNNSLTVCRKPQRNFSVIVKTIDERMDPEYIFQDCLVSVPTNDRVPLEYKAAELQIPKPKPQACQIPIQQQARRHEKQGACCDIM